MQGFDVLKDAIRRVAARTMGVDYEYLVKKWSGNYCPDKHLFEWKTDPIPDKPGSSLATFHPIWFFDAVIWEKIGKAYCDWFSVPTEKRYEFWMHVFLLCQYTPEFWQDVQPGGFADWVIHKLDLKNVDLTKLSVSPPGGKRSIVNTPSQH